MFCNLSDDTITIIVAEKLTLNVAILFTTSQGSRDLVSIPKHGHILGNFAQRKK